MLAQVFYQASISWQYSVHTKVTANIHKLFRSFIDSLQPANHSKSQLHPTAPKPPL
jgi:hypothetical protein